jgi:hypothetical protein
LLIGIAPIVLQQLFTESEAPGFAILAVNFFIPLSLCVLVAGAALHLYRY